MSRGGLNPDTKWVTSKESAFFAKVGYFRVKSGRTFARPLNTSTSLEAAVSALVRFLLLVRMSRRLLTLLHFLLLLLVLLLHLLRLLLVPLLDLLLPRIVRPLLRHALMFLVLALLQLLPFLLLPLVQLVLLLLILLIRLRISRTWRAIRPIRLWQIAWMNVIRPFRIVLRAVGIVFCPSCDRWPIRVVPTTVAVIPAAVRWRIVISTRSCRYHASPAERSGT
jgi:hypothetical protein